MGTAATACMGTAFHRDSGNSLHGMGAALHGDSGNSLHGDSLALGQRLQLALGQPCMGTAATACVGTALHRDSGNSLRGDSLTWGQRQQLAWGQPYMGTALRRASSNSSCVGLTWVLICMCVCTYGQEHTFCVLSFFSSPAVYLLKCSAVNH